MSRSTQTIVDSDWFDLAAPLVLLLGWSVAATWVAIGMHEIRLSDVQPFIARAVAMDLTSADDLVDAYYPWGYPFLLRLVGGGLEDYQRAGQLLSLVGGALTLASVWVIARVGFGWRIACGATLLVGTNHLFNEWAIGGATDAPALGWMYAALAAVAVYIRYPAPRWALAAGGLIGIGYLVRYTSLTMLPVGVLLIVALPGLPMRIRLRHAADCTAAFLVASAPQLVPTALMHGNPFWNRQDQNVYFGMFGGMNWSRSWEEATTHANGLVGIVRAHPRAFVANIVRNIQALVDVCSYFPLVLAPPGVLMLLRRRREWAVGALVLGAALTYGLAVSMAFITPRFTLPLLPALLLFAAYAVMRIPPSSVRIAGVRVPVAAFVLMVVVCVAAARDARRLYHWATPTELTRVSDALRADGVTRASEVLSLDFPYYLVGSRQAEMFDRSWYLHEAPPLASLEDIVGLMRHKQLGYLVFNDNLQVNIASLAKAWPTQDVPPVFSEIYRDPSPPHARVWRLALAPPPLPAVSRSPVDR